MLIKNKELRCLKVYESMYVNVKTNDSMDGLRKILKRFNLCYNAGTLTKGSVQMGSGLKAFPLKGEAQFLISYLGNREFEIMRLPDSSSSFSIPDALFWRKQRHTLAIIFSEKFAS